MRNLLHLMQSASVPKYIKFDDTPYIVSILEIKLNGIHSESASYLLSTSTDIPEYIATLSLVQPQLSLAVRNVI